MNCRTLHFRARKELAALNAVKTDLTNSLTNAGDNAKSLYVLAAQLQASGDLQTAAQVKEIADALRQMLQQQQMTQQQSAQYLSRLLLHFQR